MRWIVVVAGALACVSLLADLKLEKPEKPEVLSVQPEEAIEDLEEVGKEANEAVQEIFPDGSDHSRG